MRFVETGAGAREAVLTAIMLHGRGRTAEEMAELAARFVVDGVRYLCPEAPGNSWYPLPFLAQIEDNQPALDDARATIDAMIAQCGADGVPSRRIVLCGFSQGACLVADTLMRRPDAFAGALILTGGLIGPPGTQWNCAGSLAGVPVLLTGSETDAWVPAWRSRETVIALAAAGASVDSVIYAERDHLVSDDEVVRARAMLAAMVRSAGPLPAQ